jgi:hypothetical protein
LFAVAAIAGALFFLSAPAIDSASADSTTVTAAYTPSDLTMLPGEKRSVVLQIQNPTTDPVVVDPTVNQDESTANPLNVTLDKTFLKGNSTTIPAGGSLTVPATVTLHAPLSSSVTVVTTVGYTGTGPGESAIATLRVSPGTSPTAVPGAITVSPSGDTALVDTQAADVYFTIQNVSATTQKITKAVLTFPTFLNIEVPHVPSAASSGSVTVRLVSTLAAGDGTTVHLHVSAPNGVQPGDALVVLSVSYQDPVGKTGGFVTGTEKLTLSVFGEAAVTGAFGAAIVPALFVVPGVLFVLVFWFLWQYLYPVEVPLNINKPSIITGATALAILGVLCALPFPFLYQILFGRNYSAVYGFIDIARMCGLGIATGAAVWFVAAGLRVLTRHYRFEQDDSALTVLRKITRFRRDLTAVATASYTIGKQTGRVFVLRLDANTALVCPRIVVPPPLGVNDYPANFESFMTDRKDRKLYALVHGQRLAATPDYETGNVVNTVTEVKVTDLSDTGHDRIASLVIPSG